MLVETMKFSLIGPVFPYRGGIAHFTTLLAKKLGEAGHEVQVISFSKQYPAWLYPGESDKDPSPEREKVDAEYLLAPLAPLSWHRTVKAITDFKPDQVIVSWWVTFWGPAFHYIMRRVKRRGVPITMLIHNTMPHETRPWDRFLARYTLQNADRYIVMTEKEKMRLQALLPEVKKVQIIPHPIYRMFKPCPFTKEEVRYQLGLPADQPVLLFFGFVRPYKGLLELIQALKVIHNSNHNIHLLVAGEFWDSRAVYDQQIKDLRMTDYVHIHDRYIPDDEAAQYFTASDLFVAPYTGGTQSGALKSALGFGMPAVVTDIVADGLVMSLPELCKIIPAADPDTLAEAIIQQLSVPRLEPSRVEDLFARSWDVMIKAIGDIQ